jgi:hypothetical protein
VIFSIPPAVHSLIALISAVADFWVIPQEKVIKHSFIFTSAYSIGGFKRRRRDDR